MLTKLYRKSSYLSIFISYLYLAIVVVSKARENSNRLDIDISILEYIIFIILFFVLFNLYNSWVNLQAKDDGFSISERSNIHIFLFPIVFSFLPSNIIHLEWGIALYLMSSAMIKYTKSLPHTGEKSLIEIGILLSISAMIIPYFYIYLILLLSIRILPAKNFSLSKILALGLPSLITWFLAVTIKTFSSINIPYYKLIIQNENFYDIITKGFTSITLIIVTIISIITLISINKRYFYLLERRTRLNRIGFFITHLVLICFFIKSQEALILLIYPIIYGLSLLSRIMTNKIIKELVLTTLLFLSIFSSYLSFDSI